MEELKWPSSGDLCHGNNSQRSFVTMVTIINMGWQCELVTFSFAAPKLLGLVEEKVMFWDVTNVSMLVLCMWTLRARKTPRRVWISEQQTFGARAHWFWITGCWSNETFFGLFGIWNTSFTPLVNYSDKAWAVLRRTAHAVTLWIVWICRLIQITGKSFYVIKSPDSKYSWTTTEKENIKYIFWPLICTVLAPLICLLSPFLPNIAVLTGVDLRAASVVKLHFKFHLSKDKYDCIFHCSSTDVIIVSRCNYLHRCFWLPLWKELYEAKQVWPPRFSLTLQQYTKL